MNIVTKTIELLKVSYSNDLETAYKAECSIFDNFDTMTPMEKLAYRLEAHKIKLEMQLIETNKVANAMAELNRK